MRLFSACFLGCCLFFQTVNVNAMGCLQFARETARKYGINKEIPLKIKTDFDVDEGVQKDVTGRLSNFFVLASIKVDDFLGLFFESLGDAIGIQDRRLTVECYHQAANYGNVSATIKWARAVFIQYPRNLREYEREAFEKLQNTAKDIEGSKVILDPHLSVEIFKLLAGYYAGEGELEKAKMYFEKAKAVVREKFDEDYKEQILEHIDSLMRNLEDS